MIQVDQLTRDHFGHRVVFKRPASSSASRPMISGKLISVVRVSAPRPGYNVTVDCNGEGDTDTFGPLPGTFPIDVQHPWRERHHPDPIVVSPFPRYIRRVRIMFLGGTLDGTKEDRNVDEFHGNAMVRKAEPDNSRVQLYFEPTGDLTQIEEALWWGKWRLVRSEDHSKPFGEGVTKYNWGD